MKPEFKECDIVFIDPAAKPTSDDVYHSNVWRSGSNF